MITPAIRKYLGRANHCELCNDATKNRFGWMLKKGKVHSKNRSNYLQLCFSCIQKYTGAIQKKWDTDEVYRNKCIQSAKEKVFTETHKEHLAEAITNSWKQRRSE